MSSLGARIDGSSVEFSIFSRHATGVSLCTFDEEGVETRTVLDREGEIFRGSIERAEPALRYGFRVEGPTGPGHHFDPSKLLLDPYARAIEGSVIWDERILEPDVDSAPFVPRCVVVESQFEWGADRRPDVPWNESVIYETHVKGFSFLNRKIPAEIRGTFAGIAHPWSIEYLLDLGVTAVELLPVHHHVHDYRLHKLGLRNYWGYQTLGFFAPHDEYARRGTGEQVDEFKSMVRDLHTAGLEVILDVVYNHTGEGEEGDPALCFRGIDNKVYYRAEENDPDRYVDFTATGNTLDLREEPVLSMVLDSLRYWSEEMRVDGFRFDLAPTLARESSFLARIAGEPFLEGLKLIAEPWDAVPGGDWTGRMAPTLREWNGRFRDDVRDFWRNRGNGIVPLATRITGSADLFASPASSINFVACHDGFTLRDAVTYEEKHNEDNRENNLDGHSENRTWNCGIEGETEDPEVNSLRARQMRNLMATALLSRGVPMMLGGDEIARTQRGNNNPYCQDNEISWYSWEHSDTSESLMEFVRSCLALRRRHRCITELRFNGEDFRWFDPNGIELDGSAWTQSVLAFQVLVSAEDDAVLIQFNSSSEQLAFEFPQSGRRWVRALDTSVSSSSRSLDSHSLRVYEVA